MYMPFHMGDGAFWIGAVFSWILWIVIIVLAVFLVVRLLRGGGPDWRGQHEADVAEEILHRRLANGEIGVEEYEQRMTALRAQRPPRR